MTIGEKIRSFRNEKGYTQKKLANLAGIPVITLQQYELGKRDPRTDILVKIANALDVNLMLILDTAELIPNHKNKDEILSSMEKFQKSTTFVSKDTFEKELQEAELERMDKLLADFKELNPEGQKEVLKYTNNLTKIPDYQIIGEWDK